MTYIACDKWGCGLAGDWRVILRDPDGEMAWNACWAHLVEFKSWVLEQDPDANWGVAYFAQDAASR